MSTMMSTTKGATWTFTILALGSTLLYMAGLAALQYGCNANYATVYLKGLIPPAAFGMSAGFENCPATFRLYWFIFAFVIVTLCAVGIAASTRLGLHYGRPFLSGMVTICIVLMMIASEAFLGYETVYDAAAWSSGWWHARWRTTCAGAIISVVWLIFLLMAVGTDWEKQTPYGFEDRGVAKVSPADRV